MPSLTGTIIDLSVTQKTSSFNTNGIMELIQSNFKSFDKRWKSSVDGKSGNEVVRRHW